jgi:hypothetical protein
MSQPMTNRLQFDYGMPVHPVCDIFPLMDGENVFALQRDIEQNGLLAPIVVHDGQLVDGRNRVFACQAAHVTPQTVEWTTIYSGPMTLARWIWSINAERRHLTVDQYVAAQVSLYSWEESEAAKLKQIDAGKKGGQTAGRSRPKANSLVTDSSQPYAEPKRAPAVRTKLAEQLGVSEHKVQQAINVQKADPELLKKVAKGTVSTLCEAAKIVENPKPPAEQSLFRRPKRDQRQRMLLDAIRKLNACVKHSPNDPVRARIRGAAAEVSAIRKLIRSSRVGAKDHDEAECSTA